MSVRASIRRVQKACEALALQAGDAMGTLAAAHPERRAEVVEALQAYREELHRAARIAKANPREPVRFRDAYAGRGRRSGERDGGQ